AHDRHLDLERGAGLPPLRSEGVVDGRRLVAGEEFASSCPSLPLQAGDCLSRLDFEHLLQSRPSVEVELIELAVDPSGVLKQAVAVDVARRCLWGERGRVRYHSHQDERVNCRDRYTFRRIPSSLRPASKRLGVAPYALHSADRAHTHTL